MFLIDAAVVLTLFFSDVASGAFADAAILGDVGEMLVLSCASILFVVAVLRREADRSYNDGSS